MNSQLKVIFFASLFIKIIIALFLPLSDDEAYYWVWSHHLQLSYFDHPVMVAVFLWFGQFLEPFYQGVRLPSVLLGHLALMFWILIARDLLNSKQLYWFVLFYLVNPLTGIGSVIVTPDIPLTFFWALSCLAIWRIFQTQDYRYYLILGMAAGLGFISKYSMVLLAPVYFGSIYLKPRVFLGKLRVHAIALMIFVLAISPLLIWNFENDWASFAFQLKRGLAVKSWTPLFIVNFIVGQTVALGAPVLYLALSRKPQDVNFWLIAFMTIPFWFFGLSTLFGEDGLNWTLIAFPPFLILAVAAVEEKVKLVWAQIAMHASISVIAVVLVIAPFEQARSGRLSAFTRHIPLIEHAKNSEHFFARDYQTAALLSFELKRMIYKLKGLSRVDFYDQRTESIPTSFPFQVALKPGEELPTWALNSQMVITKRERVNSDFEIATVELLNQVAPK